MDNTDTRTYNQWINSLSNMNFDQYCIAIKNKILESNQVDTNFKQQFNDCFDYVYKLYKNNKTFEPNLIKIYLEDIKGYKNIKMTELFTIMILLSYCGFSFNIK